MSEAPRYYLQQGVGSRPQLWRVEACQTWGLLPLTMANPVPTGPENEIWDVNAAAGWRKEDFFQPGLKPGLYHPRMARPITYENMFGTPITEEDEHYISEAIGQLIVFCSDLDDICRTVQPNKENLAVYGHDIRNLLILACTEVEAHWKGVLRLNGAKGDSTRSYVKLLKPLQLDQYKLRFARYRWLGDFAPFQTWDADKPTESLAWYSAYNGAKHDREKEFSRASLAQVFNAVAACAIMLTAQFGWAGLGFVGDGHSELMSYFTFSGYPSWQLSDHYIDYFDGPVKEFAPAPYQW